MTIDPMTDPMISPTPDALDEDDPLLPDPALVDDAEAPVPPGEILGASFMLPQGLLPTPLARALRVPVNRITDILSGKRRITAQTALLLATYFDTTPEFWLRLQMEYDLRCARRRGRIRTHLQAIQSARRLR
ncbi:HigA family addiction module antitoxin [Spiribacter insolitus]|uniref:HigA family addiction module antitoxin n=1 Tax=Spiribacter insolitus TaxID=3122417 RepID=A0ABV3T8P2_9GAMM